MTTWRAVGWVLLAVEVAGIATACANWSRLQPYRCDTYDWLRAHLAPEMPTGPAGRLLGCAQGEPR